MATPSPLPSNVHISKHPCLLAKLSQLRARKTEARETKALVHEIALILGCEALATALHSTFNGTVSPLDLLVDMRKMHGFVNWPGELLIWATFQNETPLGYIYTTEITASDIVLIPVLRSGLGMLDGKYIPPTLSSPL